LEARAGMERCVWEDWVHDLADSFAIDRVDIWDYLPEYETV
jgi:hypothetical protein